MAWRLFADDLLIQLRSATVVGNIFLQRGKENQLCYPWIAFDILRASKSAEVSVKITPPASPALSSCQV